MLQHASGREPEWILLIGTLRRGFIGKGKDARLAVGKAVEFITLARLDVGIVALAEAPARFLTVDDRPAQAAYAVIGVEGCQIMTMAAAKGCVFLKQALLHIKAKVGRFRIRVSRLDIPHGKLVDLPILEEHVVQRLAAVLRLLGDQLLRPNLIGLETL
jgi:hypothetical protein